LFGLLQPFVHELSYAYSTQSQGVSRAAEITK
jgi:hypothetical protein